MISLNSDIMIPFNSDIDIYIHNFKKKIILLFFLIEFILRNCMHVKISKK
jgi:hypothetical protein